MGSVRWSSFRIYRTGLFQRLLAVVFLFCLFFFFLSFCFATIHCSVIDGHMLNVLRLEICLLRVDKNNLDIHQVKHNPSLAGDGNVGCENNFETSSVSSAEQKSRRNSCLWRVLHLKLHGYLISVRLP